MQLCQNEWGSQPHSDQKMVMVWDGLSLLNSSRNNIIIISLITIMNVELKKPFPTYLLLNIA